MTQTFWSHISSLYNLQWHSFPFFFLVVTSSLRTSAKIGNGNKNPSRTSTASMLQKSDPDQLLQQVTMKESNCNDSILIMRVWFSNAMVSLVVRWSLSNTNVSPIRPYPLDVGMPASPPTKMSKHSPCSPHALIAVQIRNISSLTFARMTMGLRCREHSWENKAAHWWRLCLAHQVGPLIRITTSTQEVSSLVFHTIISSKWLHINIIHPLLRRILSVRWYLQVNNQWQIQGWHEHRNWWQLCRICCSEQTAWIT